MDSRELMARIPRTHFIDGRFTDHPTTLEVVNPATGKTLTSVADGDATVGVQALDAACAAQGDWARTDPRERAEVLRRTFDIIGQRADDFAHVMVLEMGKSLAEARGEVAYGAEFLRWFSEEAVRIGGQYRQAPSGDLRIITTRQPVGPVYAITPWNFPLAMGTRKIGPALAAGCTVVLKPAQLTPLTSLLLMQALADAGLPPGVVNCVVSSNSAQISGPVIADPRLRKLTFTGSTPVGRRLIEQSAERVLRTSLELGGNAAFLVLASADLDRAVEGAVAAKMRNIGQACTAANRFLVHESLAEQFSRELADRLGAMTVGDGMRAEVGPVINEASLENLLDLVADAVNHGATVLTGGDRAEGPGYFMQPTVLTGVDPASRVMTEEVFGPVAPITTFATLDEGLRLANDTEFGLMGYVFAEDINEALTAAEAIESGVVAVNSGVVSNPAAPFGGMKASGLGREGGHEGLAEYLETKYIGLALGRQL